MSSSLGLWRFVWLFGGASYWAVRTPSGWVALRSMLHGSDGVAMIARAGGWDCCSRVKGGGRNAVLGEKFGHRHDGIPISVMSMVSRLADRFWFS